MTFDQIDAFLAAVRSDTFFDAAESLHITQSTLSKYIMKLEKELDVSLFDRTGRSAVLTDAGRVFYDEAQALHSQYHHTLTRMQEIRTSARHSLRLGTLPILSQYRLTGTLKSFSALHPEIHLTMEELEEQDLIPGLLQNRFDLIIIRDLFLDRSALTFYPLAEDRLVAVLPADHPLAKKESVSIDDIKNEPLVLMPPYTALYRLCLHLFREAGLRPNILRTARMESILSAVEFHEGISLFAGENYNLFRHDFLTAVPLAPSPLLRTGAAIKRTGQPSPAVRDFLLFCGFSLKTERP